MEYKEMKAGISSHLNAAAEDFFMVGYFLRQISENALFTEDGYKSIWEFAKGEYGLSTSSASRFMAINARFSVDGGEHMAQKYIGMGVSKLQEMLSLPDEELEKVTKETTVREIRAMKAQATKPLSFYGLPATKRPEGSTLVGCGDGKHDCFDCCRDCAIRQEQRYCNTAPLGNPYPCSLMGADIESRIQNSYVSQCQMLHPELAPIREGDKEPNPCCLTCGIKTCYMRCDVARKRDEQEQREREAEERRQEREREAARPEPSDEDIEAFYRWARIGDCDPIWAEDLKQRYRHACGGGAGLDYNGTARGIRLNHKKEITYIQLAKRLKECQEKHRKEAEAAKAPAVIDAEFTEIAEEPKKPELETEPAADPQESQEPETDLCETCAHEGECAERKTIDSGCMGYEEIIEAPKRPDPESYELWEVRGLLNEQEKAVREYREAEMPESLIRKQIIIRDALRLLLEKIEAEEAAAYED